MAGETTPVAPGTELTARLELWGDPVSRGLTTSAVNAGTPNLKVVGLKKITPDQADQAYFVYAETTGELTVNQVLELLQSYAEKNVEGVSRAEASIHVWGDWPGRTSPLWSWGFTGLSVVFMGVLIWRAYRDPEAGAKRRARKRLRATGGEITPDSVEDWLRVHRTSAEKIFRGMWPSKFSGSSVEAKKSDPWGGGGYGFGSTGGSAPPY